MRKVVSEMLTLGGWWGMKWQTVRVQNGGSAREKPKNQLGRTARVP